MTLETEKSGLGFLVLAKSFEENVEKSLQVLDIDKEVMTHAENALHGVIKRGFVTSLGKGQIENVITALADVRKNGSLRTKYGILVNQLLVAMVSYFESSFSDLFQWGFTIALKHDLFDEPVSAERLKVLTLKDVAQLRREGDDSDAASLVVRRLDLKFQNTKNVVTHFEKYFGIPETLIEPSILNDTICAVECRHSLVHKSGAFDDQLISNLTKAKPRTLKANPDYSEALQFSEEEIRHAYYSMKSFIEKYANALERKFSKLIG